MRRRVLQMGLLVGLLAVLAGCASRSKLSRAELDGLYQAALERFEAGDHRTALRRFQIVRDERPDYPRLQHHMGICYAKLGLANLAVEALSKAASVEPENRAVQLDLAVALELARRPREAERIYQDLLRAHPDDPRIELNLGLLYVRRLDEPEKGRPHLLRFLELRPGDPDADEVRRWLEQNPAPVAPPAAPTGGG